ncbi:MAG: hypothetical protein K940chlam7_01611 [Chlamydiae bacterium]|nr:hypothetical protein [Chlamydiota bacterium]
MANYGGMYDAHLDILPEDLKKNPFPKPIFRSSTIFPVFHFPGVTSRFLFMGYWIVKRQIKRLECVVTLRSLEGQVLNRASFTINKAKAYRIELAKQLERANISLEKHFMGSLEVEIFSSENLYFSFPAGIINYYGPSFSTFVHSTQRVYNDYEDMSKFQFSHRPESGFNIYADGNREPFIGLNNGIELIKDYKVQVEFINMDHETLKHEFNLGTLHPYQTHIIYPEREVDLQSFLKGKLGTAKVKHRLNWVFPRLAVGNIQKNPPAISVTHTYYDCTECTAQTDYWNQATPEWHNATLMVPLLTNHGHYTNIYFYPMYPASEFQIDIEIYNSEGAMLNAKENVLTIVSPSLIIREIAFKDICEELNIDTSENLTARIIANPKSGTKLPARVKIGLDIGKDAEGMPCNISTNLYPFNPKLETKPRTFRWLPIMMDQNNASVWITNSSAAKEYTREAQVELIFFREKDEKTLTRNIHIPPHGFRVIYPQQDVELEEFFEHGVGWLVVKSSSPHTNTYYFVEGSSGVVGGDHGF